MILSVVMKISEPSPVVILVFNLFLLGLLFSMAYLTIRLLGRILKTGRQKISIK